ADHTRYTPAWTRSRCQHGRDRTVVTAQGPVCPIGEPPTSARFRLRCRLAGCGDYQRVLRAHLEGARLPVDADLVLAGTECIDPGPEPAGVASGLAGGAGHRVARPGHERDGFVLDALQRHLRAVDLRNRPSTTHMINHLSLLD